MDITMNEWIEQMFHLLENEKNQLEVNNNDLSLLNEFFLKTINGKDNVRSNQT